MFHFTYKYENINSKQISMTAFSNSASVDFLHTFFTTYHQWTLTDSLRKSRGLGRDGALFEFRAQERTID